MSVTAINSPFRYPGGKYRARSLICSLIPQHSYYAEPFAGGASIFFAKDKVVQNVLNDIDCDLINCYTQIRDNVQEMIGHLAGEQATRERYDYYKNEYQTDTKLKQAVRWYYLNRTSFSGIMNPVNCYWGYGDEYSMQPKNWPAHLRKCSEKLQGVELQCGSFENIITSAPTGAFLFIDPPYFATDQARIYTYKFTKDDHMRLKEVLMEHRDRVNFLLTYDDCPEIRKLYSWADFLEQEWQYTLARTDDQKANGNGNGNGNGKVNGKGKRTSGKELFILNFSVTGATTTEVFVQGERNAECQHCSTK